MTAEAQEGTNVASSIRARREILDQQLELLDIEIDRTQNRLNELVTDKMRIAGAIEEYEIIFKQLQGNKKG